MKAFVRGGADTTTADAIPPFSQFIARRFAVRSPFWSWLLFERAGGALAYGFARMGVSPWAVTLLGGAAGVSGAAVLGTADDGGDLLTAAALLLLGYTLDCSDGQLARATGQTSAKGAWLDVTVDAVIVAFLTASLSYALSAQVQPPFLGFLVAGVFGASRTAGLFTATRVRSSGHGGMQLTGLAGVLKIVYGAATDTPFVYAMLCATRLIPGAFRSVVMAIAFLTLVRVIVSAHHHFRVAEPEAVA